MGVFAVRPNRPVEAVLRQPTCQSFLRTSNDVTDTFMGVAAGHHCNSVQAKLDRENDSSADPPLGEGVVVSGRAVRIGSGQ